jgi:hypothetical protein
MTKASNSAEECVIRVFVEENCMRRNMRRCGRRETIDNDHHALEHMVPIVQQDG